MRRDSKGIHTYEQTKEVNYFFTNAGQGCSSGVGGASLVLGDERRGEWRGEGRGRAAEERRVNAAKIFSYY